jgi:hypothetical protein
VLRYDPDVIRVLRLWAAAMLVIAVSSAPLLADWCAASCESARQTGHAGCHHMSASGPQISQEPVPCGHDHHPLVLIAPTDTSSSPRATASSLVALADAHSLGVRHFDGEPNSRASSRSSPPLRVTLSSTLRI